jgi:hypothetical protein
MDAKQESRDVEAAHVVRGAKMAAKMVEPGSVSRPNRKGELMSKEEVKAFDAEHERRQIIRHELGMEAAHYVVRGAEMAAKMVEPGSVSRPNRKGELMSKEEVKAFDAEHERRQIIRHELGIMDV